MFSNGTKKFRLNAICFENNAIQINFDRKELLLYKNKVNITLKRKEKHHKVVC